MGHEPEFESLAKLLDRCAEFGAGKCEAAGEAKRRTALDHRLTDEQHTKLQKMLISGLGSIFQVAARMGYANVERKL